MLDDKKLHEVAGTLNVPQGHVSAKTVASVKLIQWELQRLFDSLKEFDYQGPVA